MTIKKTRCIRSIAGCALFSLATTPALGTGPDATLRLRSTTITKNERSESLSGAIQKERRARAKRAPYRLITLDRPLTPKQRERLEGAGIKPLHYVGDNTWIVSTRNARARETARLRGITWQSTIDPAWKLDPLAGDAPVRSDLRKAVRRAGECVVQLGLMGDVSNQEMIKLVESINGAQVIDSYRTARMGTLSVLAPIASLRQLASLDGVMYIEHYPEATLRNETARAIVQSATVTSYPIHAQGITGLNQIIGVLDNRMDVFHCSVVDPAEPVVPGVVNPNHRKILAFNDTTLDFPAAHGTHVAVTAAGDNGATGDLRGNAYNSKLVFNLAPSLTDRTIGTILRSRLDEHHSQGARIHTNSWGYDFTTDYNGWCAEIDSFMYDNEDSLVIFAVTNTPALQNPENAKNALAVAQTKDTTLPFGMVGDFDEFGGGGEGPTADGRRKPDILAPGTNIVSANIVSRDGGGAIIDDCTIRVLTGTSMAAPAIAGAAAMTRQYFTEGYYPTGTATPGDELTPTAALLKSVLINSSQDITQIAGFLGRSVTGYPTDTEGWGRVQLDEPLYFPGDSRTLIVEDVRNTDAEALSTTDVTTYQFNVTGQAEQLRVTLAFTDVEGVPFSATPVVNDIDLEVVDPSLNVYLGNVFDQPNGVSMTGGTADPLNNVEQVHIDAPMSGTWEVRVKGTAVNTGTQGYALVITGEVSDCHPADFNCDGSVDGLDLGILLGAWGTPAGDLDDDGNTNGADLGILLGNWGP
ncbi:MAG: S8 family serine peptidase [Phycisphaerales bacterium JB043]